MSSSEKIIDDFVRQHNLRTGDIIVTSLFKTKQSAHFILPLEGYGFIQNTYNTNVDWVSIDELAYEIQNNFKRIDRFNGSEYERTLIISRALEIKRAGRRYNLATYNCEHFIEEARTGKVHSKQVDNVAGIGIVSGLGLAAYGGTKKNPWLVALGLGLTAISATAVASNNSNTKKPNYY
jgi:hypothetical protein